MMEFMTAMQNIGPMVEQLEPTVAGAAADLRTISDTLVSIDKTLDAMRTLMADYVNYQPHQMSAAEMISAAAAMIGEVHSDGAGASVEADRG